MHTDDKPVFKRHDRFFRSICMHLREALAFLQGVLGPGQKGVIKWESLRRDPDSYVTDKLKEYITDMVFWADWVEGQKGGLVFLLEHKSGNSGMPLRLQVETYVAQIRLAHYQKTGQIPLIVPIVFYHGKEPLQLDSYSILPEESKHYESFKDYLPPDQKIMVVDLNQYSDEELLQKFSRDTVGRFCLLMKHIFDPDLEQHAHEYLGDLGAWEKDEEREPLIKSFLLYLKEEYQKRKLPMEAMNTTARQAGLNYEDPMEVFAIEYINRGKAEGEARGESQKAMQVAKAMKEKGYPNQEIAELTGLSIAEVEAL